MKLVVITSFNDQYTKNVIRSMYFEILTKIIHIETIAVGSKIREIARLHKQFGKGRWRSCEELPQSV